MSSAELLKEWIDVWKRRANEHLRISALHRFGNMALTIPSIILPLIVQSSNSDSDSSIGTALVIAGSAFGALATFLRLDATQEKHQGAYRLYISLIRDAEEDLISDAKSLPAFKARVLDILNNYPIVNVSDFPEQTRAGKES